MPRSHLSRGRRRDVNIDNKGSNGDGCGRVGGGDGGGDEGGGE